MRILDVYKRQSLYAMMILSQLFLESGAWQALARPLRRFSTALFGLPESYFALFLLSQFAGYPVGASMLCTLTKQGVLSKEDASRLLCVCYGGGPAFLLGLLGTVSSVSYTHLPTVKWESSAAFLPAIRRSP